MTFTRLALLLPLALALGSCADAARIATDPAVHAAPAPAPGAAIADPLAGTIGSLRIGMSAAAAIAAMGTPEISYADFLAWHGGHVTATLVGDHIVALRSSDRTIAIGSVHVGDTLAAAEQAFPGGALHTESEIPYYMLPGGHAWLEVLPTSKTQEIAGVRIGAPTPHMDAQ